MATEKIIGYNIDISTMKNSTCGTIGIAEKHGEKYFCKRFSDPVEQDRSKKMKSEAVADMKQATHKTGRELHHLFVFAERAFEQGNEMLILVTELTVGSASSQFIATFGCPDYQRHNQELMLTERQNDMQARIEALQL